MRRRDVFPTLALLAPAASGEETVQDLLDRARAAHGEGRSIQAIAAYDEILKREPRLVEAYNLRGAEHFRAGQVDLSIADFDSAIRLDPRQEPYHWQRGISYYYARRYREGRTQFEKHQTVNSNDVENAVWHYLCAARVDSPQKARAAMIAIESDGRVPMMQIYALFRGTSGVEDVIGSAQGRREALFYAHLYCGLYEESVGDADGARKHIFSAAGEFSVDHYMGDVARVHARLFRAGRKL